MTAFMELSADRHGRARIPWTAIDAFARRYGVEGEDFDELVTLVRELDKTYLEHLDEKDHQTQKLAASDATADAERRRRDALG